MVTRMIVAVAIVLGGACVWPAVASASDGSWAADTAMPYPVVPTCYASSNGAVTCTYAVPYNGGR